MIASNRSFESVRNATTQAHLMPVEKVTYPVASYELHALAALFLVVVPGAVGLWWLA